jgi:MoaA/NifB/PqqE/SkfB family radical SAM enzyme
MKLVNIKKILNVNTSLKRKNENIFKDVDVFNENVKIIDITNFLDQDFKYGKLPDVKNIENFYSNYKNLIEINSSMNFKLADEFHDIFKIINKMLRKNSIDRTTIIRILSILANKTLIGPHTVHFDINNACNTACIFCGIHPAKDVIPYWKKQHWKPDWLHERIDIDFFKRIIDELIDLGGCEYILFSGEGEPLLHPQIKEMISYLDKKQLKSILFTNGKLLTKDMLYYAMKNNIEQIYWSISSCDEESYLKIHPKEKPGTFNKMFEEIKFFSKYKNKLNSITEIFMVYVIMSLNYYKVYEFIKLAKELNINHVRFQLMHSAGNTRKYLLKSDQLKTLKVLMIKVKKFAKQNDINVVENIDIQMDYIKPNTCSWSKNIYQKRGCYAGWFFSRIYTDKSVSFCCQGKVVGEIDKSFKDIWESPIYNRSRSVAKNFETKRKSFSVGWRV